MNAGEVVVGVPGAHGREDEGLPLVGTVLVGQFEFTEWMPDNHLRHSRFVALRAAKERLAMWVVRVNPARSVALGSAILATLISGVAAGRGLGLRLVVGTNTQCSWPEAAIHPPQNMKQHDVSNRWREEQQTGQP